MDRESEFSAQTPTRRYQAWRLSDGFILDGGIDRQAVRITLRRTYWRAEAVDQSHRKFPPQRFGLFEVRPLINLVAKWSMRPWQPRPTAAPEWMLRRWAVQQASRSVAWVVAQERRRLMHRVDPLVADVQRALFAACCATGDLALIPEFYRAADHYLIDDIRRYRAAAMAVRIWGQTILADGSPNDIFGEHDSCGVVTKAAVRRMCRTLSQWRKLFSNTGQSYSALNRTLDRLPGGMSPVLLEGLGSVHLERAIQDRVELTVLLCASGGPHPHSRLFQFARREEILRALPRVGDALHRKLSPRRTSDLARFARYLCDFPHPHAGNIAGLAARVIRWHREAPEREETNLFDRDDCAVAPPPVPPPEVPGLRFLDTVGAIRREGALMGHCIANYVRCALLGRCFLFHYERGGQSASAEVSGDGQVRQSYGPGNVSNRAARDAARLLMQWARTFPAVRADVVADETLEAEDIPF